MMIVSYVLQTAHALIGLAALGLTIFSAMRARYRLMAIQSVILLVNVAFFVGWFYMRAQLTSF